MNKKAKAITKGQKKSKIDLSAKRTLVEELQLRDSLFFTLAQATRELVLNADWLAGVREGLTLLCKTIKADRVYLFENDLQKEGEPLTTSQRFEWAPELPPQINRPDLQNLPVVLIQESFDQFQHSRPHFQIVSKIKEGSAFKKILQHEKFKSVLAFPIFFRNYFWGFIGFAQCSYERYWAELETSVLNSYAAVISGAIYRKEVEMKVDATLKRVRESEERYRTLQEASYGGIALHDKGLIIDCNQGLCNLTGYSYEELIGSNGIQLIAPEHRAIAVEKIVTLNEQPYDVELIRKDGSRISIEVHGKNIPYSGNMIRVTEFRDVTERKQSELKIREQNARLIDITNDLKRKNDQLQEFAQIVSHNLRAPLGNILSIISFYEASANEKEREEYFGMLKNSGHAVNNTLSELVSILKIRHNAGIERQAVSFEETLDKVKKMFVAKINEVRATIKSEFEVPTINYPSIYLESILLNLLSNSLKYIRETVAPVITFKTYQKDEHVMMEVSDNGLGIDLEKYGHQIFKLNKTFHLHAEARGIGLFITKNQIEAMGGEINVFSKPNEGATFVISFDKYAA